MAEFFRGIARRVTLAAGSWQFFLIAIIGLLLWAISGPIFVSGSSSANSSSTAFTSANLVTFLVYAANGGVSAVKGVSV